MNKWDLKRGDTPEHWLCTCGQPNASQRDVCLDCGKTPKVKNFKKRIPTDALRGGIRRAYS